MPLYAIIAVAWLVFTIIGAVKESNGETYEYPYVIKFFPVISDVVAASAVL